MSSFRVVFPHPAPERSPQTLDGALRHVATAVASNSDPAEVFSLVAEAICELLAADSAGVVRYEGPSHGRVMGQAGIAMPPHRFTLAGENSVAVVARTGEPAYVHDFAQLDGEVSQRLAQRGQRCGMAVPVMVEGR